MKCDEALGSKVGTDGGWEFIVDEEADESFEIGEIRSIASTWG